MDKLKKEMLEMKNWAIIGVTPKKDRFGYKIWKKMEEHNYNIYGVNPRYDEIDGKFVYNSIKDIKEDIDVVDIVVGPKITINLLDEIKYAGIEYIFFQPGTYNEQIIEKAEKLGFKYIIDDCIYATLIAME